jgi:chemotaxis protein MotB
MKKKPPQHVNHERWLVSYADFITLLFAFFVVLYSSSQVDKRKAGHLALAIQIAFQELGVFQASSTKVPVKDDNAMPFEKVQVIENIDKDMDLKRIVNPMKGVLSSASPSQAQTQSQFLSLQEAQQEIQKALDPEIQRHEVAMSVRGEGLVVSLREMGFFESGSSSIRPKSLDAIGRLANVLNKRPENLRIEGHTDNIPIHTPRFANNWELSTARATGLIQVLISTYGILPNRLSVAGYAEFHPVSSNETPEGRAKNRRLDVVILTPFQSVPQPRESVNREPSAPGASLTPLAPAH